MFYRAIAGWLVAGMLLVSACSGDDGGTCETLCDWKQCGSDGCGGTCGECPEGESCSVAGVCEGKAECIPNCDGRQCGGDDCGGSCGDCAGVGDGNFCTDTKCQNFQCVAVPNANECAGGEGTCVEGQCCVPNCFLADGSAMECGDDGCGGTCGECRAGSACVNDKCINCTADCTGKECGDDGCGGDCGSCEAGEGCKDGLCQACQPACGSKECGDDGCGGDCGSCDQQTTCVQGQCQCAPQCTGKECGSDGCGGSCGDCGCGFDCVANACQPNSEVCPTLGGECDSDADCAPPAGAECFTDFPSGFCVVPDCDTNGDCPAGGSCIEVTAGDSSSTYCVQSCSTGGDCRPGYFCYPGVGVCWWEPDSGASPIGGPCQSDADCEGATSVCYPEMLNNEPTGFVEGYCVVFDCTAGSCPEGSDCVSLSSGTACLPTCVSDAGCREGYACDEGFCLPFCGSVSDCPAGYLCDAGEAFCVDTSYQCSPSNPMGWCPEGLYCIDGECTTFQFDCTDQTMEPNESKTAAKTVTPGVYKTPKETGMQVCVADQDWFKMTIPAGHTGTLGVYFYHDLGDLDLCMYDSAGKFVACRYLYENYPITWREYDWNDEFLSAFAGAGPKTFYFKASGFSGAANNYDLYGWTTAWQDGFDCADSYSFYECKGCKSNGQCIKDDFQANLHQFPHADGNDPFVGDGYIVEHASGYSWARRETIMLIRWAIHEVRAKFPGTKRLGLMDMCQIDGITPGFDVGIPRHPETTHDEGGNIDVAYYQTGGGDSEGGVICDANGGSTDGYFCTSVANHIVDLPRTAYFLAKLSESDRMRVAGADKLIAPLIIDALKDLKNKGDISTALYNKTVSQLAYGDGWPFHHHHIHVSLKWWSQRDDDVHRPIGCGFRMAGDGTWDEYLEAPGQ